ncbi:hypothetical protein ABBQ38_011320 [Trebouxia sp. C0009 RCD-2024]
MPWLSCVCFQHVCQRQVYKQLMPQQLFAVGMSKPQLADREDSSISDLPETVEQSLLCRVPDNFQRRALRKDCHYKPSRRVSQSGSSGRPAEIHRSFSWFNVFSPVLQSKRQSFLV